MINTDLDLSIDVSNTFSERFKDSFVLQFVCIIITFILSVFILFTWIMLSAYITHEADVKNEFYKSVLFLTICCFPVCLCSPLIYMLDRYYFKTKHEEE